MTTLTKKEEKRAEVIQRVLREELTTAKATLVLGFLERQSHRIKAQVTRVREVGAFTPSDPVKPDLLSGVLALAHLHFHLTG